MDSTFPLSRDPTKASPPPDLTGWQREIADARQGLRSKVGTQAAALYIGVHQKTLLTWVREGAGPESIKNPSRPGTTALNQRLGFTLGALDAFIQSRTGDVITRGKRSDMEAIRREGERIQAAIALKVAEDQLAKARERAKRLGVVCFETLSDATEIQPWVRVGGRITGHAWVVDDESFEAAGDDIVEGTLEEVLGLPWKSGSERRPYADALLAILSGARAAIEKSGSLQHAEDLNDGLPPPIAAEKMCRRCGKRAHPGAPCRI